MWQLLHCFDLSHLYIQKHTHTETHTHTHTHTHARTCKIQVFNIGSNNDPGQIERNKLKYLHYLNKMTKKMQDEEVHFQ